MLKASVTFFILGIISMFLGINSIAGLSIEIGKILLGIFLVLSVISFVLGRNGKLGASIISIAFIFLGILSATHESNADDTVYQTTKEVTKDSKRAAQKAIRSVQDKTCQMVSGKMKCAVQKAKHAIQNTTDKVEDAID